MYTASDSVYKWIKSLCKTLTLYTAVVLGQDHIYIHFIVKDHFKTVTFCNWCVTKLQDLVRRLGSTRVVGCQKGAAEQSFYPVVSLLVRLRQMRVITPAGRLLYYSRTSRSWGMHRAPMCWLTSFISLLKGNADGRQVRWGYGGWRLAAMIKTFWDGLLRFRLVQVCAADMVFMKLKIKLVYSPKTWCVCG